MLQGLSPLLSPDLLHLLASMGHGDAVALVDANFPAAATAQRGGARLVTCLGSDTPTLLHAVLSVLPLDKSVAEPAAVMVPEPSFAGGFPGGVPEAAGQIAALVEARGFNCARVARFAFYEQAAKAFGIVRTGELRVYGNVILSKGVVTQPR